MARKPKAPKIVKPPLPAYLRPLAEKALAKHMRRAIRPRIDITGSDDAGAAWFACPYAPEDQPAWEALLFETFGTRSERIVSAFLANLAGLCPRSWIADAERWGPDQQQFDLILGIIGAMKPRNEAEAALAAQLCALNITSMRLARRTIGEAPDPLTVAVQIKAVNAYAGGMLALQRLQGRGRTSRQSINSRSDRHVHYHGHNGGGCQHGSHPHEPRAGPIEGCTPVSGESSIREALPVTGDKGQARLPSPRRRQRVGRTDG